ncbi:MAG: RNA-binding protein [Pirellulaceae bacterium]|nr:MAG: RNA-binding protein [Pirellulaceae bacterium]
MPGFCGPNGAHRNRLTALLAGLALLGAFGCRPEPAGTAATENRKQPAPKTAALTSPQPASPASRQSASLPAAPFVFADVTDSSGITHYYYNGEESNQYTILESLGGGAALADFNRDGMLDIVLASGGKITSDVVVGFSPKYYTQAGRLRFRPAAGRSGFESVNFYHHGIYLCDYDQDGWIDVLITGYGRLALFKNVHGEQFTDVTAQAGLDIQRQELHWSTAAVWADFNEDGHSDLFVGHYVDWRLKNQPVCAGYGPGVPRDICPPNRFAPLPCQLFYNNGDGTFREAATASGLLPGKILGAIAADWTEDGLLDLYVANDAIPNQFYVNQGDGTFREEAVLRGVAGGPFGEPEGSMGLATVSLDVSGTRAIAVTNYQGQLHGLYEDRGRGWFDYAAARRGLAALGTNHVGWGIVFADWDRDGDRDAVIAQGHVIRHPPEPQSLAQPALLLQFRSEHEPPPTGRFVAVAAGGYFAQPHRARAIAAGDLDNDGALDLVITHIGEPTRLLHNQTPASGNWWGIDLGCFNGRDKSGWKVVVEDDRGRTQHYSFASGEGYLASHDMRLVVGLGAAQSLKRVTITDDLGRSWSLPESYLAAGQYHRWDYRSAGTPHPPD